MQGFFLLHHWVLASVCDRYMAYGNDDGVLASWSDIAACKVANYGVDRAVKVVVAILRLFG